MTTIEMDNLDRWLAKNVMGWEWNGWKPTRRIDQAMLLEPKLPHFTLRRRKWGYECQSRHCGNYGEHVLESGGVPKCECRFGVADTAALAICLAAKKALEGKRPGNHDCQHSDHVRPPSSDACSR